MIPRMVFLFDSKFPLWGEMRYLKLKAWFNNPSNSEVDIREEDEVINLPAGGILWQGQLVELAEDEKEKHEKAKKHFKLEHGATQAFNADGEVLPTKVATKEGNEMKLEN